MQSEDGETLVPTLSGDGMGGPTSCSYIWRACFPW